MEPIYLDEENAPEKDSKNNKLGLVLKAIAMIMLILSLVLLAYGLIPQEKFPPRSKHLQGGNTGCFTRIDANEGDILIIDYTVVGTDVSFYLTYGESWCEGNYDYIVKSDSARDDHFEVNIKETGYYYLSFERNEVSNTDSFEVDLSYKILSRFSPLYLVLGAICLIIGIVLTVIYLVLKRKPSLSEEDSYIRI
ncbi:MAG: hypothetical protein JSW00_17750 [Thermoplasmata archaeon]|nr:MAG: hypothetical protein JSW00_17750 [Thermoplasmata archaeon]